MSIVTIILFFIYLWGLGFSATFFLKKPENFLERQFLNLGLGLAIMPLLLVILNLFRLPIDWRLILVLSLVGPIFAVIKKKVNFKNFNLQDIINRVSKPTKADLKIIALLAIFAFSLNMYASGAFNYPYLENEDPWDHAVGTKYVALEKDLYDPDVTYPGKRAADQVLTYIDPYPPGYDGFLGVLHQTSPDITWTLKFFNALIISLGLIFFYLFAKKFTSNSNKALFATFVLAAIPAYLSHFIWAHALIVTIFFPTMYAFLMISEDKRWAYLAAICLGSIWVTQLFEQPIKLTTLILLWIIIACIIMRKFLKQHFAALVGGFLLSFLWWIPIIMSKGLSNFLGYFGTQISVASGEVPTAGYAARSIFSSLNPVKILRIVTDPGGTASRAYTFSDFFVAPHGNQINAPIGIGIVVSLLVLIGVAYLLWNYRSKLVSQEKNVWRVVALIWLVYTFWGVNGMTFPFSVAKAAFRIWMLLAIPIALVAAEGMTFIKNFFARAKVLKVLVIVLLLFGIFFTSAQQKYDANTAIWPTSGSFNNQQEPFQYAAWFDSVPVDTKVFLYAPRDKLTIGFGKFSCEWCQEVIDFRQEIVNKDAQELHSFLSENDYEYILLNPNMDRRYLQGIFGENTTQQKLPQNYQEILESGLFTPVHQAENQFLVLRVN